MTDGEPLSVECRREGPGWSCTVRVGSDNRATEHQVTVSPDELERFAPAASEPGNLVERSFRFLLEREPNESILRRFALTDIERYFPEYPAAIGRDAP